VKFAKTLHHILKLFPMLSLVLAFTIITFISCSNPTMSTNSIVISKNDSITLAYSDEDPFGLINNVKIEMINSGFSIVALEAAKTPLILIHNKIKRTTLNPHKHKFQNQFPIDQVIL